MTNMIYRINFDIFTSMQHSQVIVIRVSQIADIYKFFFKVVH